MNGRLRCLRALLAAGADREAQDEHGRRPLHMAAERGHSDCARALLLSGADKNAKDNVRLMPPAATPHLAA